MACLSAPKIPPPPGLSLLLPPLALAIPSFTLNLCCTFETPQPPGFPIILPLGLLIPAGAAVLIQAAMAAIMAAIDKLNSLLDELQFSCPLEE